MKLTPIPQKGARGAGDSTKRSKRTTENTLEGKVKRQKSSSTAWPDFGSRPAAGEPSKALRRTRRQKTSLLDLPGWFLVDVFMLEKNFSFPRCCGWIGRALSHPYDLRRLIADGFSPTWDVWFGCAAQEVVAYQCLPDSAYDAWIRDKDRFGGDPKLQSDILAQKWLTLDRLLQAQQLWFATKRTWTPTYYRVPLPWRLLIKRGHGSPSLGFEGFLQDTDFSVREQFELEYKAAVADMAVIPTHPPLYPNMLEVHQATCFPDRLITGPWAEDDVKLLFWLGRAGAVMSNNQSWEIVIEGLGCMASIARRHGPESPDINQIRNHVSQIVRLFEMFKFWNKVPYSAFFEYRDCNNLSWLLEVLAQRTQIGEVLVVWQRA
ncbi:hypothetical protein RB595_010022 [Gaeumannomyces hyphopodioides]